MSAHNDILEELWANRPKCYTAICQDLEDLRLHRMVTVLVTPQADRAIELRMAVKEAKEICAGHWERGVEYAPCMSVPDTSTIACIGLIEGGIEPAMLDDAYFDCSG